MNAVRERPPLRSPKVQGERSERKVIAALLEHGYEVLIAPYGENRRYDLVLDLGDHFARVQTKTARLTSDRTALVAATCSFAGLGSERRRVGYRGQVEIFAIFSPDTGRVYLLPVDECPGSEVRLRLTPPKNGQAVGIRYAVHYELRSAHGRRDAPHALPGEGL